MNQEVIDREFAKLVAQRGIHHKLVGVTSEQIRQHRSKLKKGIPISTDLKLELLRKSGWKEDAAQFTRGDLVAFAKFYARTSAAAREQGAEYVVEKWLIAAGKA
ncbi:MAG: hypothetical protein EOP84_05590 [Verrucomicrobiaceae bacterium]|nr:MAG: hypothetical protein EOP84_05590 [Verrucomicrobiaceae bacterium]